MYKVIENFTDLQDNNYKYHTGDNFPRKGAEVSEERLNELSTDNNRRHRAVIEKVEEPKKPEVKEETEEVKEETKPVPKKGGRKKADAK